MIARHLSEGADQQRLRVALVYGTRQVCYEELARLARAMTRRWSALRGARVGLRTSDPVAFLAGAVALDALGNHAFLLGTRTPEETLQLEKVFKLSAVVGDKEMPVLPDGSEEPTGDWEPQEGMVTILTSGTTGTPKAGNHTWRTLASPVRGEVRYKDTRWFCPYALNLYAGTQVLLQAFLNWATLVVPTSTEPSAVARTLRTARVTHASGTPTFWRQLLFFAPREELARCELRQLTVGGEAATQDVLDRLRVVFPGVRIVHIYASTELGRLFSVTDGLAGFPARFLESPPEAGIELRILGGELYARSRNAMLGYDGQTPIRDRDEGWLATGDLVEVRGDRVMFQGRRGDLINVGGAKVFPSEVESVLHRVPGVAQVRVYGKHSSLAGALVAADIVLIRGADEWSVRSELQRVARQALPRHAIPRLLRFVQQLEQSDGLKVVRRVSEA